MNIMLYHIKKIASSVISETNYLVAAESISAMMIDVFDAMLALLAFPSPSKFPILSSINYLSESTQ